MDSSFKILGDTVLERWKRENFSLEKFPAIAQAALDERPPATHVNLSTLMHDFLLKDDQPVQTDSDFGQPEIIAYSHPRFYIQLLFWMDGTTAIHQHEFSGAFHVMHGSSIHARYDFEDEAAVTPYLRVGNLRMREMELLPTGRTVPIASGRRDIHSLFHLESPSVTVVVRTQHDPGTGPQLNYMPPHVAFDPQFSDTLTTRRKQLLDMLQQIDDDGYGQVVAEMIADLDFERGFSVLHHCRAYLQHVDQWDAVLHIFTKKHGTLASGIAATLNEDARRNIIKDFRSTITEPEHRFFLALLMNAPTRTDLLNLVAHRFPKPAPTETVLRWLSELAEVTDEGTSILDVILPETIEIDTEAQPELLLSAIRYFMNREKKRPPAMGELSAADVAALREAFAESTLGVLTK